MVKCRSEGESPTRTSRIDRRLGGEAVDPLLVTRSGEATLVQQYCWAPKATLPHSSGWLVRIETVLSGGRYRAPSVRAGGSGVERAPLVIAG